MAKYFIGAVKNSQGTSLKFNFLVTIVPIEQATFYAQFNHSDAFRHFLPKDQSLGRSLDAFTKEIFKKNLPARVGRTPNFNKLAISWESKSKDSFVDLPKLITAGGFNCSATFGNVNFQNPEEEIKFLFTRAFSKVFPGGSKITLSKVINSFEELQQRSLGIKNEKTLFETEFIPDEGDAIEAQMEKQMVNA